jgi:hypothetical protein
MPVLNLKDNSYRLIPAFEQIKQRPPLKRVSGHTYSRESGSRSVSDEHSLSSFQASTAVIESLFVVQGADVYRYLQSHAELYSLLLRSRAEIYWLFGPRTGVALRMERDPEEEYCVRLLVAIQTGLNAARALELVDMLDEKWWLSVPPQTRVLMKIDVEYV